jgi:membrane protease YdiL (CAAX protease family)
MPSRGRAAGEAALVVAAVMAPGGAVALAPRWGAPLTGLLVGGLLFAAGVALVHGAAAWQQDGPPRRALRLLLLLACAATIVGGPLLLDSASAAAVGLASTSDRTMAAMVLRNGGTLGLVWLLLRANRQGPTQLGLGRTRWGSETLFGLAALTGALALHLAVSAALALGVGLWRADALGAEAEQRAGAMGQLLTTSNVPAFVGAMVFAAAFEEIAFRGFVLPRARHATSSWAVALVVVAIPFGLGHLYEGPLAVVQTGVLGLYFSALLMWRGHLLAAIVAHVGFNTVMMSLALALRHAGAL